MSDEKTLFNINEDDDAENGLASNEDTLDFSLAFDGEDEDDIVSDKFEEKHEEYPSAPSLFKGLSFLKKREKRNNQPSDGNNDEDEKEDDLNTEDQINKPESDAGDDADNSATEEKTEEKQEKRKKFKGFLSFGNKQKEPEVSDGENDVTEKSTEEQPFDEDTTPETEETEDFTESADDFIDMTDDAEETKTSDEDVGTNEFSQNRQEEIHEEETPVEEQKSERKKFGGFGFLKRKIKDAPVQAEETPAEADEEPKEETEIEFVSVYEESSQDKEEPEKTEETVEAGEEKIEVATEENNSVEAKVEENVAEEAEKEIGFVAPFEASEEKDVTEEVKEEQPEPEKDKEENNAENAEESTSEQGEKSTVEMMTAKDHLTFILIILALLLTIAFIVVKFIPLGNTGSQDSNSVAQAKEKVSEIQIKRGNASGHYIQSDLDDLFYVYSEDYIPAFYQWNGNKMSQIRTTEKLNVLVETNNGKMSARVDYVKIDGKLFGTGYYNANQYGDRYILENVIFKLVDLPKGYEQEGKALLLATNNLEAVSKRCSMWNDSYVVDLETGETTRFLTSNNSAYSAGYALLTDEGYASANGSIPFFSTRDYDATTNKRDIYLKTKGKETRFATDVAGSFVYADNGVVSYLKVTDNGFNVVRKENGKEKVIFSLDGNTSYLYHNEYLLDKYNGNLYNVKTGEKTVITGYGMSNPEMMTVSPDGRYLVVVGAVNSAIDYQVHIFDLKTGNCAKYVDDNFSQHENLAFADNTTIVYSAVEPKQGYEYVILDASKAF